MKISGGKLVENEDFRFDVVSDESAILTCFCGVRVKLTKDRSSFSLSNIYKHFKSKRCALMKKKRLTSQGDAQDMDTSEDHIVADKSSSQDPTITNYTLSSASSSTTAVSVDTPDSSKRFGSTNSILSHKIQRVR